MRPQDKVVADRLARARGQLSGVIAMLEAERDCEAVATQLAAVRAAVERATALLVSVHIDECVRTLPRDRARRAVRDAVAILERMS